MKYLAAIPVILGFMILDIVLCLPAMFIEIGSWPWSYNFARQVWGLK